MLLAKIAFRNVFRQKRRSLLTGLTMIGGFVMLSLSISISDGTYDQAIEAFTLSSTGHVQIHRAGYLEKPTLFNTFTDADAIGAKVMEVEGVESWTPRVFSPALTFIGSKTTVARIVGIDPVREPETTHIREKIGQGRMFGPEPAKEAMIGGGLAEVLNAKPGDELVLIAQGADGSIANDLFKIVAVLKGGINTAEARNCYLQLQTAQDFLVLPGRYHELVVTLNDFRRSRWAAKEIARVLNDPRLEVEPWEVIERPFYRAMMADKEGMWVSLLIIIVIVAIGVLNTVLMSILERTREYGVLKALGTRPGALFKLILLETTFLAVLAVVLGTLISLGVDHYMSLHGISYPEAIDMGGIMLSTMQGTINLRVIALPALVTFFTALLVSVIPAVRAMRIKPVQAMRL